MPQGVAIVHHLGPALDDDKRERGWSSSTQMAIRGSPTTERPLTEVAPVVKKTESSSSRANHTGATWGRPSARTVATFAVRAGSVRKARHSSLLISATAASLGVRPTLRGLELVVVDPLDLAVKVAPLLALTAPQSPGDVAHQDQHVVGDDAAPRVAMTPVGTDDER